MESDGRLSCPHGVLTSTMVFRGFAVNHFIEYQKVSIYQEGKVISYGQEVPGFKHFLTLGYCPWLGKYYIHPHRFMAVHEAICKDCITKLKAYGWVVSELVASTAPRQSEYQHGVRPLAPAYETQHGASAVRDKLELTRTSLIQEVLAIGETLCK